MGKVLGRKHLWRVYIGTNVKGSQRLERAIKNCLIYKCISSGAPYNGIYWTKKSVYIVCQHFLVTSLESIFNI